MTPKTKPKNPIFMFEVDVTGELEVYIQAPTKEKARQSLKLYLENNFHLDNKKFPKIFTEVNENLEAEILGGDEVPDES